MTRSPEQQSEIPALLNACHCSLLLLCNMLPGSQDLTYDGWIFQIELHSSWHNVPKKLNTHLHARFSKNI
jgi:hypothetical protein